MTTKTFQKRKFTLCIIALLQGQYGEILKYWPDLNTEPERGIFPHIASPSSAVVEYKPEILAGIKFGSSVGIAYTVYVQIGF